MNQAEDHVPEMHSMTESHSQLHSHSGLLWAAGLLAGGLAIVAGGYGIYVDAVSLKSLALNGLLASILCWLSLNATRVRRQVAELEQSAKGDGKASETDEAKRPRWGSDEYARGPDKYDAAIWRLEHARKQHYLLLAVGPTALVWLMAIFLFSRSSARVATSLDTSAATALGIVCLAVSCLWLVLSKSFSAVAEEELNEQTELALAFRDVQWSSVLTSVALLGSFVWGPLEVWAGRVLLCWVFVVCSEQFVRLFRAWLWPSSASTEFIAPFQTASRHAVLVRGNPVSSLFDAIERRLGVSFRSSWAIRFVRAAITPMLVMVVVLLWGLSSLSVVEIDRMAVRESFGRISGEPLGPGLHWKLPWPFGTVRQYPVKKVFTMPVGGHKGHKKHTAVLWTKKHTDEEFSLLLGNGTELIAMDTVVYYKIREDAQGFLDYVYGSGNPDEALQAYAYRVLTEHVRSATLSEVFTLNRAEFAGRLERALRDLARENRLGIDVVEVALVAFHPPVEVADAFLDVISSGIDATRAEIEAAGEKLVKTEDARRESKSAVATAQVKAAKRVGTAQEESAEFLAIGGAYAVAPVALQLRLWFETLEEILKEKRFVVVDSEFAGGPGGILLDQRTTDGKGKSAKKDATAVIPEVNP